MQSRFILLSYVLLMILTGCNTIERKLDLPNKKPLVPVVNTVELKINWDKKVVKLRSEDGLNSALLLSKKADQLFAADVLGNVIAVDINGKTLWQTSVKEAITSGPSIFKDRIYVATATAKLICLSANNGQILWNTNISSEVLAGLSFSSDATIDLVFVHTIDGGLSAINLINGRQLWRFSTAVPNIALRRASTPVVAGEYLISGFANGKLFALNKEDAALLWSYNISNPRGRSELQRMIDISADPIIKNNTVYAVSYQGNLVAIDLKSGSLLWEQEISSYSGMEIYNNILYVVAKDGKVFAIDASNGQTIWTQDDLIGRVLSKPVVVAEHVIIGDMDGNLHFLGKRFGQIKARIFIDSNGISITPVVDQNNNLLYLLTNSGRLIAVNYVTSSYNNR